MINGMDVALGRWCQRMRKEYRNGKLSNFQIEKLNAIDFDWDPLETEWMRRYEQYKRYIKTTGSAKITRRGAFEGENLGAWVETQRKWYTKKDARGTNYVTEKNWRRVYKLDIFITI